MPNCLVNSRQLRPAARAVMPLLAAFLFAPLSAQPAPADLILTNGNIYTVYERLPRAEAIAIRDGKILSIGSNEQMSGYAESGTRTIDLRGFTVVPGLTDSHYHLAGVGMREMTLNLEGAGSLEQFLARVKERVDQAQPREWVTGRGWIETFWKPQKFPTRWDLDKISPNNPVYLTRADGHGAVANSVALQIAKITRETPDPSGGEILKDAGSGEPTGMLVDRAQGLVARFIPPGSQSEQEEALARGAQRSVELGWTQVQNAGGSFGEVDRLRKLYAEGRIALRVYQAIRGPGRDADQLIQKGAVDFDGRLTVRAIKVSIDGALGSKGAALLEPYADHDSRGLLMYQERELLPMFVEALRKGIQIETHAIGDRANRLVLDFYEKAFQAVPPDERKTKEPRWRIEHAQVVHPEDLPRFAKLGVIPSMQPSHAISDLHFAPSRLGQARLAGAYAWRSFLNSGCIIAGGSDAPVERGEPMIEFYAAAARKDLSGYSGEGWHPEQAVTREEALKMFTIWPAYAAFEEERRGSIAPGKLADLTVLSADIMTIPEREIPDTRCVMTLIGGVVVFESKEAFARPRPD